MDMTRIYADDRRGSRAAASPRASQIADRLVAQCLAEAVRGEPNACFNLGVAFSTGSHGVGCDLIEAHKWFNLAALAGHECAKTCRADIAGEMSPGEIAEAQRRARAWIAASTSRRAA